MAQKKPNAAIPRDPQRGGGSVYPPPPSQGQDLSKVTSQNGVQGIVGKGGNFQPLGQAAQTRLTGGGAPPAPPTRPAVLPVGPSGPNVFHPTNPNPEAGVGNDPTQQQQPGRTPPFVDPAQVGAKPLQIDGQPWQMDTAQALQHLNSYLSKNPAGAPGVASMDGVQGGQPGPAGMFNHPGQQLGVGNDQTQQQGGGGANPDAVGLMGGENNIAHALNSYQGGGGYLQNLDGRPGGGLPTKPMGMPGGDVGAGGIAFNPAMRQTIKGILAGGGGMGQPRPTQPVLAGGARY